MKNIYKTNTYKLFLHSAYKSNHLSLDGRLVLLKYVMSSLPVYALSFVKAPSDIVSSIKSFFFGGGGGGGADHRKISWVDCNSVCRSKEVGGLEVRRIREFNIALLRNWCWRQLEDGESLWFRVLSARYGVCVCVGGGGGVGREASLLWRDVHALCRKKWFSDHVRFSVENGKHTLFWSDVWLGGVSFRVRFSRLYDLSVFKGESVFDMYQLG